MFAASLGAFLRAGDVILLSGGLGAGKSHFARALIQSRLAVPEDVPSPTFTIVQTYDAPDAEIWHADLYRVTDPLEVAELGLLEAFHTAICLVEWPDRLGEDGPNDALEVSMQMTAIPGERSFQAQSGDPRWYDLLEKARHATT